jgi:hypothetical protein
VPTSAGIMRGNMMTAEVVAKPAAAEARGA